MTVTVAVAVVVVVVVVEEDALQEGGVLQLPWARASRAVKSPVAKEEEEKKEEEGASWPPARFGVHAKGFRSQPPSWRHRGDGRGGDRQASGVEEGRWTRRWQVRMLSMLLLLLLLLDGRTTLLLSVVFAVST